MTTVPNATQDTRKSRATLSPPTIYHQNYKHQIRARECAPALAPPQDAQGQSDISPAARSAHNSTTQPRSDPTGTVTGSGNQHQDSTRPIETAAKPTGATTAATYLLAGRHDVARDDVFSALSCAATRQTRPPARQDARTQHSRLSAAALPQLCLDVALSLADLPRACLPVAVTVIGVKVSAASCFAAIFGKSACRVCLVVSSFFLCTPRAPTTARLRGLACLSACLRGCVLCCAVFFFSFVC
ncbi:uncharacterized protein K452DRAFT_50806 [Aplosporella prunicola CBS 121167]|uniref:Uncharacterized protein n=1 Tax=Aplosporella prunicola CBS 121167 TaxID=1176127 RepID=A0A6A6BAY8_9PEZI|nr:uncharacterized protein K452DRAFT_50806 [Aplosporella prunicola CBS 121167]KAF2140748.1 hypothetical protein K452DRAFT_50806 [Aplosporella prunicola CBS 121167]